MPPRTAYVTEQELVDFLESNLPRVLSALSWNTGASRPVQQAVENAMRALDLSEIGQATDVRLLELVAIREVWQLAANNLAPEFDTVKGDNTDKTSQLYDHAVKQLGLANDAIATYLEALDIEAGGGDDVVMVYPVVTPRVIPNRQRYWWEPRNL